MLGRGDPLPAALVWHDTHSAPIALADALAGDGFALLCFYVFDWSPT